MITSPFTFYWVSWNFSFYTLMCYYHSLRLQNPSWWVNWVNLVLCTQLNFPSKHFHRHLLGNNLYFNITHRIKISLMITSAYCLENIPGHWWRKENWGEPEFLSWRHRSPKAKVVKVLRAERQSRGLCGGGTPDTCRIPLISQLRTDLTCMWRNCPKHEEKTLRRKIS